MFDALLKVEPVRKRVAFALRNHYYGDLQVAAPIGGGLRCPIAHPEYWWSFEEVFFTDEYRPVFERIPLPNRWLDLGCHAGFFSLFVALQRKKAGMTDDFAALLIDGDSRVARSIEAVRAANGFGERLKFLHGAIAAEPGELFFEQAMVMSSALVKNGEAKPGVERVPVIRPEQIVAALPPPYDLVKIDVEGAEHDFLTTYAPVLNATKHLLLEWHSWHFGGGGLETIRSAASAAGFREIAELVPSHAIVGNAKRFCGVLLFERA